MYQIIHPLFRHVPGTIEPPEVEILPGFHVNATGNVLSAQANRIYPNSPVTVFAGAYTYYYRFDSAADAAAVGFTFDLPAEDPAELNLPLQSQEPAIYSYTIKNEVYE